MSFFLFFLPKYHFYKNDLGIDFRIDDYRSTIHMSRSTEFRLSFVLQGEDVYKR